MPDHTHTTNDADEPTVWTATDDCYHHSRQCSGLQNATVRAQPASATDVRRPCPICVSTAGRVTDAALIEAVRAATRAGDTHINGEPGYAAIADHLDHMTAHGLRNRLPALVSEGRLERSLTTIPGHGAELATFAVPAESDGEDRTEVWAR